MKFGEMSKIGQKAIPVPKSVQLDIQSNLVVVKGSKGELTISFPHHITLAKDQESLIVKRANDNAKSKADHGLYRSIIANAVTGVEQPWTKRLEVVGTGFNVKLQGQDLFFKIGYSHPVVFKKVEGVTFQVEGNNICIVAGTDKQLVGQVAYQIKLLRKPDVYKGKGIRYEGEVVRIKPGKKAKTTA